MGEAREWDEAQNLGLGEEFLTTIELQAGRLEQAPLLYAEVVAGVRRALLPRFPHSVFDAIRNDLVYVLAVIHNARSPQRWPKRQAR